MRELGYDKDYEGLLPEDFAHLTDEEKQLLGGDVSRTHLVKGLDMVLLEKVITVSDFKNRDEKKSLKKKRRRGKLKK